MKNLTFKQKVQIYKDNKEKYDEAIRDELKNNSIVLSFAFSIIIIGLISVFYTNNNTLLIGIALSALLLTLIQCFSNGNTILNILPIFTLLIFGFFQESIDQIPVVSWLLKSQYANFIIFLSFSLTFLTQAFKNVIFKHDLNEANVSFNNEKNKMIYSQLDIIKRIRDSVVKIQNMSLESGLGENPLNKELESLIEYVEDQTFISNVKSTLITKGSEDRKTTFNIEEIEESIVLNSSSMGKNRNINVKNNSLNEAPSDEDFMRIGRRIEE